MGPISADRKIRFEKNGSNGSSLNDSHWLNDLDFLFEGSRYQSQMMNDQLEFQHQVRIMEYSLDEELEKLRKEHKSIEMKLDSIHQEKRRLVTEEIT